jgi:hypothetical protein
MADTSPGGYLDPSETDQEGLLTRLDECLGIPNGEGGYTKPAAGDWQVAECLSIWWRPNLDTFAVGPSLALNVNRRSADDSTPTSLLTYLTPRSARNSILLPFPRTVSQLSRPLIVS